jgi:O-antigen ligase
MNRWKSRPRVAIIVAFCVVILVCVVVVREGYATNIEYLGGLLLLEGLAAALWNYRQRFFAVLILVFVLAGTNVPMQGVWTAVRWLVLGTGALVGLAIYVKDHSASSPRLFQWIAFSCVISAATSAGVSSFPKQPLLKALSLFLLFLYGSFGAKLAIMERDEKFVNGLLWGCEALIYFAAVEYFILHREFFGNPNSLGAVMGVAAVPLMMWGMLVSRTAGVQRRRKFALLLSLTLLAASYSRASIVGAAVSCVLLCAVLRRYQILIQGVGVALAIAIMVAALIPLPNSPVTPTLSSRFVFKGKERGALLSSRRSVWDTTIVSIEQRPWFGTGFGTVRTEYESNVNRGGNFGSNAITTREHGNSYLAIVEGVGLVGVVPFVCLLLLTMANIGRVLQQLWRTRDPFSPAVPIAFVLIAGLVHAMFEDWLFAAGYYLCIFFWSLAFMLPDLFQPTQELAATDFSRTNLPREDILVPSSG